MGNTMHSRNIKSGTVAFEEKHNAGKLCGRKTYLVTLFLDSAVPTHTLCSEMPNAFPLQQTTVIHGHNQSDWNSVGLNPGEVDMGQSSHLRDNRRKGKGC